MKHFYQSLVPYSPIFLAVIVFIFVVMLFRETILAINFLPIKGKILPLIFAKDVLVGLTVYLKTSIDFALFIGNLMSKNPGIRNRIAIETGTALGNAFGTILVLFIWTFFREIPLLLVVAIIAAAIILLQLANESLKEYFAHPLRLQPVNTIFSLVSKLTNFVESIISPITRYVVPKDMVSQKSPSSLSLFFFSLTIPFVLGLDDFAGYIPLFTVVNVFGFATGAFLGHMLLNIGLFASPHLTIKTIKLPIVQLIGATAFILIALWGFYEAGRTTLTVFQMMR